MSIEREINEGSWSKLSNDDQALYEKDGESYKFVGVNSTKLMNAKNHERDRANRIAQELKELKASIAASSSKEDIPDTSSESKPQVDKAVMAEFEKMKRKMAEKDERHKKDLQLRESQLRTSELQRHISNVVSQVFEDQHLGELILEKRLDVEIEEGKPVLKIRNRDGEYDSDMGITELIKDLQTDDRYKNLGKSSLASGSDDSLGQDQAPAQPAPNDPSHMAGPGGDAFRLPVGENPQQQGLINYLKGTSVGQASDDQIVGALRAAGVDIP